MNFALLIRTADLKPGRIALLGNDNAASFQLQGMPPPGLDSSSYHSCRYDPAGNVIVTGAFEATAGSRARIAGEVVADVFHNCGAGKVVKLRAWLDFVP